MMTPAPKVPMFSAVCGLPPSLVRTKKVPTMETTMPDAGEDQRQEHQVQAVAAAPEAPRPRTMAPMMEPT